MEALFFTLALVAFLVTLVHGITTDRKYSRLNRDKSFYTAMNSLRAADLAGMETDLGNAGFDTAIMAENWTQGFVDVAAIRIR